MTEVGQLADLFNMDTAAAVDEALTQRNLEFQFIRPLRSGYTDARLALLILRSKVGTSGPRQCIAKVCPPDAHSPSREGAKHDAAFDLGPPGFARRHLVRQATAPVPCPRGRTVVFQEIAGGSIDDHRALAALEPAQLTKACRVLRKGLLDDWTGRTFRDRDATVAGLLAGELGDNLSSGGWLHRWATDRGVGSEVRWIETDSDGVWPNPLSLLAPDSPASRLGARHLVGRSHGDLHGANVLVPCIDGFPRPKKFVLIDLATFEPEMPLSRDLATLTLSLVVPTARSLLPPEQTYLIDHLCSDELVLGSRQAPAASDTVLRETVEMLHSLHTTRETDITRSWLRNWRQQIRVSLLAQALLHATYDSMGPEGRWWAFRLATRLSHRLLPAAPAPNEVRMRVDPGLCRAPVTAPPPSSTAYTGRPTNSGRRIRSFVNRDQQLSVLRATLPDDRHPIVLVTGPQGVGKTALVDNAIDELTRYTLPDATPRICRYSSAQESRLTIARLIEDVENGAAPTNRFVYGEESLLRLEAALDAYSGPPLVIVVDPSEHLLDTDRAVRDADLDQAFDLLAARKSCPVTVVLLIQAPLQGTAGTTWVQSSPIVEVNGLTALPFVEFLDRLDSTGRSLTTLPPAALEKIHERLRGNPRLAELLHALVSGGDWDITLAELPEWLAAISREEVAGRVIETLVDGMASKQRRVVEALAALGTEADEQMVVDVLDGVLSTAQVTAALQNLERRLVSKRTADGWHYVPRSDIEALLAHLPDGNSYGENSTEPTRLDLLHRAANVLSRRVKGDDNVSGPPDLHLHFAQVDVLLRAELYGMAHEAITRIDPLLRRWNQSGLLREQREAVRGKLDGDDEAEIENLNALGDIYSSLGLVEQSEGAYLAALALARPYSDRLAIRRVYINLGFMYLDQPDAIRAQDRYELGLAMAEEDDDQEDRLAALAGLADCHRHRGDYAGAVRRARSAMDLAHELQSSRGIYLALRLARWNAELDDLEAASHWLARADAGAAEQPDMSLQAAVSDGRADLALYRELRYRVGMLDFAAREAQAAVDLALVQRDPRILLRARTTLCMVHLHRGKISSARREIEWAARNRREGRDLTVLALRGLLAQLDNDRSTAAEFFTRLGSATRQRTDRDRQDFAAWDLLGLAECAHALESGRPFDDAVGAFTQARRLAPTTPGLLRNMAFLVRRLAGSEAARVESVLDVLGGERRHSR